MRPGSVKGIFVVACGLFGKIRVSVEVERPTGRHFVNGEFHRAPLKKSLKFWEIPTDFVRLWSSRGVEEEQIYIVWDISVITYFLRTPCWSQSELRMRAAQV